MAPTAFAQSDTASTEWVRGLTIVDGAAVYEKPSFDSTVVEYIGENQAIVISRRAVKGEGGLGLFYRLKANGRIYYITDTDIKVDRASGVPAPPDSAEEAAPKKRRKKPKKRTHIDEETGEELTPYFTRYLGGAVGMVDFTEKFSGRKLSSQMTVYGLRMTGPGTLIDGPPFDMNILFSMEAPDYYSKFTTNKAKGFMLHGDLMFQAPFYEWKDSYLYYGLGVMWTYTNYKIKIRNSTFDSQELRVGADFGVGYALRLNEYIVRVDYKYFYETTRYAGIFASLQKEF